MPVLRSQTPVSQGLSFQRRRPAPTGLNLRSAHAKKVPRGFNKHPLPVHPQLVGGQLHYAPEKAAAPVVRCSATAADQAILAAYTRASESHARSVGSSPKKQGSPIVAKIRRVSKRLSMASLKSSPSKAASPPPAVPALPIGIKKQLVYGSNTSDVSLSSSDESLASSASSASSTDSLSKAVTAPSLTPMFKFSPASSAGSVKLASAQLSTKASPLPAWLEDVDAYLAQHSSTPYWLAQGADLRTALSCLSAASTAFSIYSVASALPTPAICASRSPTTFAAAVQSYAMHSAPLSYADSDSDSNGSTEADLDSICSAAISIAAAPQRDYVRTPWVDGRGYDTASSSSDDDSSASDSDMDGMTMGTDSAPTSLDEADELHAAGKLGHTSHSALSSPSSERIVWSPDAFTNVALSSPPAQRPQLSVKFAQPASRPALKQRSMSHSSVKRPVPPPIVIAAAKAFAVADLSSSDESSNSGSSMCSSERDITDGSALASASSFVEVALASVDAAQPKVAFRVSTPKYTRRPVPGKRGTQERLQLECERMARLAEEIRATELNGLQARSEERGRAMGVKLLA